MRAVPGCQSRAAGRWRGAARADSAALACSYLADVAGTPRSTPSSRSGQTSALLERISRLQSRLNERVSLAGLANSLASDKRKPESASSPGDDKDRSHASR